MLKVVTVAAADEASRGEIIINLPLKQISYHISCCMLSYENQNWCSCKSVTYDVIDHIEVIPIVAANEASGAKATVNMPLKRIYTMSYPVIL